MTSWLGTGKSLTFITVQAPNFVLSRNMNITLPLAWLLSERETNDVNYLITLGKQYFPFPYEDKWTLNKEQSRPMTSDQCTKAEFMNVPFR